MKDFFLPLLLLLSAISTNAQERIRLYPGPAPGSESWTLPEHTDTLKAQDNALRLTNISEPSLTVFRPKGPNGTTVLVCPGGAFRWLSIEKEGYDVARWLTSRGITAVVLKYRVLQTPPGTDPSQDRDLATGNYARFDSVNAAVLPLAIADGLEAIRYLRRHSAQLGIESDRIGMMGFSAGGALAIAVAQAADPESRPDFIAPIYAYCSPILNNAVPAEAPPLFMALADDDKLAAGNATIYQKWHAAGRPAEVHIYPKGGHGFGLRKQNLPIDLWTDRFMDWLDREGLLMTPQMLQHSTGEGAWRWHRFWDEMIRSDWAGLKRYAELNRELAPPQPADQRVVFYGNSITEGWVGYDPDFFAKNGYVGRGIGGQTTGQMLVRFRQDVLNLKPNVVVILAGTNDIAGNTGETTLETTFGNLASMAELARANQVRVVLSSVLPVYDYPWSPGLEPADKIVRLNAMLKEYALKNDFEYLDYHSVMADERKGLPEHLAKDGVHPTLEGYKVMEGLVQKAIEHVLSKK